MAHEVFKQIATGIFLIVYAIASHLALIQHWLWLAFALAVFPLLFIVIGYVLQHWRSSQGKRLNKTVLVIASLLSGMGLLNYWASLTQFAEWVFLIQHVGTNALLGAMFAVTLLPNKTPLVSQFAAILHHECPADMLHYTRQVTWAWVWFFSAMCIISLGLFFFARLVWWSAFINLLAWPLVGIMFAAEFAFRRWHHPHFEKVTMVQGVSAFTRYYTEPKTPQ